MKKYDQIGKLFLLLFAIFICVESGRLPLGSFQDPGPGFLPLGSGIFIGVLSVVGFLRSRQDKTPEVTETWYSKEGWKRLVVLLIALFGYAVTLEILGFLLSTFLFFIFLFRAVEPKRWIIAGGSAALASSVSYVIFQLWLKVQLPKGFWGF